MNKCFLLGLLVLGSFVSGTTIGYIKGRTSLNIELYKKQIIELNNQLNKKQQEKEIDLNIIESYHIKLNDYAKQNNKLKEELINAKDHLNNTNHITNEWVQYVSRGALLMPEISESSSGIYAESAPLSAYSVARSITDNFETCNANAVQLNSLIDWINKQITNFNK